MMLSLVGFALSRILKPFFRYLGELLNWEPLKAAIAPLTFSNGAARAATDRTGPAFKFVYDIRLGCYVGQNGEHMGIQSNVNLEYAMYTRAQQELVVFLQDTHGTPENINHIFRDKSGARNSAPRFAKCLETIKQLESPCVLLNVGGSCSGSDGHFGR